MVKAIIRNDLWFVNAIIFPYVSQRMRWIRDYETDTKSMAYVLTIRSRNRRMPASLGFAQSICKDAEDRREQCSSRCLSLMKYM